MSSSRHEQLHMCHSETDYIQAVRRMTYLVKAADLTLESLYEGRALERAVWRYEALWIPLMVALAAPPDVQLPVFANNSFATKVAEVRSKNFAKGGLWLTPDNVVPPIDIAWVWYVHRLNPDAYEADLAQFSDNPQWMHNACATNLHTAFKFSDGEDSQSKPTRRLWDIVFPFEHFVPKYMLSHSYDEEMLRKRQHITSYTNEMNRSSFRSVMHYDLVRAVSLQRSFCYQIISDDDPEPSDRLETTEYLTRAWERYLGFLELHAHHPEVLLVPMADINMVWHMHLASTTEYSRDCEALIGRRMKHDAIAVDDVRQAAVQKLQTDSVNDVALDDDTREEVMEKRRQGIAIKETKVLWETLHGANPRYDVPDTRYRGQPPGDRGGFYEQFLRTNGTTRDISWPETLARMLLAIIILTCGGLIFVWSFWKTMSTHGKYLVGLPLSGAVVGLGTYVFLAIPISRPLSSESRYWLDKSHKHTHDPLPPYLVSPAKKVM